MLANCGDTMHGHRIEFEYTNNPGNFPLYRHLGRTYYRHQPEGETGIRFVLLSTEELEGFVDGKMFDTLKSRLNLD